MCHLNLSGLNQPRVGPIGHMGLMGNRTIARFVIAANGTHADTPIPPHADTLLASCVDTEFLYQFPPTRNSAA
jgi:hypothetical protein